MAMIKINGAALRECCRAYAEYHGTTVSDMSEEMGYNRNFLSISAGRDAINAAAAKMLESMFGIGLEEYTAPAKPKDEWRVDWDIEPLKLKVCARILHNGEPVYYGYSRVKEPVTNMNIMQAISYATHICYKKAEQAALEAL